MGRRRGQRCNQLGLVRRKCQIRSQLLNFKVNQLVSRVELSWLFGGLVRQVKFFVVLHGGVGGWGLYFVDE